MNRVLFKAAAIVNIAAAALIYVACSGDDGKDGPPGPAGAPCTVAESTTVPGGIDVICGSDRKTLGPGPAGAPGAPGQNGQGVPADGCYLALQTAGYNVICGGVDQGALTTGGGGPGGGCTLAEVGDYYQFTCGAQQYLLAKAICSYMDGNTPKAEAYDPAQGVCITTGIGSGVSSNCGGLGFNRLTQFCTKATADAETETIFARCGALYNEDGKLGATADSLGLYNPITEFCIKNTGGYFQPGEVSGASASANLEGEKKTRCDLTWQQGTYTVNDFCRGTGATAKVYLKCLAGANKVEFNPTTQFCQPSKATSTATVSGLGPQTPGTVPGNSTGENDNAVGQVKPRCGTQFLGSNTASNVNLAGLGVGTYGQDKFCSPLATPSTGATGVKIFEKCINVGIGTAASDADSSAKIPNQDIYQRGEYDVRSSYCKLTVGGTAGAPMGVNALATATIADLETCPGTSIKYAPAREFCGPSNILYPICDNGKGTYGTTKSSVTPPSGSRYDYEVASQYCDTRGRKFAVTATSDGASDLVIQGGKLYNYVNLGGKNWLTTDLELSSGTEEGTGLTANTKTFTWLQATSEVTPLCPEGWRLSSDADWTALATAAGQYPGNALRTQATSGSFWAAPSENAAYSAFLALPTTLNATGTSDLAKFYGLSDGALNGATPPAWVAGSTKYNVWWTSGELNTNVANVRYIKDNEMDLGSDTFNKLASNFSVRCVK